MTGWQWVEGKWTETEYHVGATVKVFKVKINKEDYGGETFVKVENDAGEWEIVPWEEL